MGSPLHILHLEDDPRDAELVRGALEEDGLLVDIHLVDTREAFSAALELGPPDLILSDYALPQFDGLSALQVAQAVAPEVPFIVVSGTLGEEAAVESVRQGATDYILKQRLARLGTSVRRAMAELDERRKRRIAEEALRESEEQLRHTQKMEAIGRLAGGVAHDFNNLLTVIIGHSEMAQEHLQPDISARRNVEEVLKAAQKAAALTRQLLAFSRRQVLTPRVLSLNAVITDLEGLLRSLIGSQVDLRIELDQTVGAIKADPSQIEQVIVNLALNARDAMVEGGVLTIETAGVQLGVPQATGPTALVPGLYASLMVRDTGCGMDDTTRSKIFEPFFTTKDPGKGTGLGLATVHGIVQQSGGSVEVSSRPGEGSTFTVLLPCVDDQVEVEGPVVLAAPLFAGSETILVLDDDEMVRHFVCGSLQAAGYTVIEAADRETAIEACEAHECRGIRIALLLADRGVPGMTNAAMEQRLSRVQHGMKRLQMSGSFEDEMLGSGNKSEVAFLEKPFTVGDLLRRVRDLLDESTPATSK